MLSAFFKATEELLTNPLNPSQTSAVSAAPDESLFLLAGPGSGKTTVLALRTLKLVFVDELSPTSLVATTFTRKAARELRSRILGWGDGLRKSLLMTATGSTKARIESVDLNAIWTGTLDSLCEQVLGQFRAPGAQAPAPIEDFVAHSLMLRRGLFPSARFREPNLEEYAGALRGSTYGLNPAEKANLVYEIRERIIHDDVDIAAYLSTAQACDLCGTHPHAGVATVGDALTDYQAFLSQQQVVDYALLEKEFFDKLAADDLAAFSSELRAILVDEYQDTNLLQETIYLTLGNSCLKNGGSIAVVGDDDQSLYRFRGATVDLFNDFPNRALSIGATPRTIHLSENYRSTDAIVDFCQTFVQLDAEYQPARARGKPAIVPGRKAAHNPPILGLFRDNLIDLAQDLTNFIDSVFNGTGATLSDGTVIRKHPQGGISDAAFISFSPSDYSSTGNPRLPMLLRQCLAGLASPIDIFNPRGQRLTDFPWVRELCGLALECIDPGAGIQAGMRLPRSTKRSLDLWRASAITRLRRRSGRFQRELQEYVRAWRTRSHPPWPSEIPIADLVYKLVTWVPEMQHNIEGLVHFEVVLRTVTEAGRFSPYSANIVLRAPALEEQSIQQAIWAVFAPIAEGAVDIDEDLLETFPADVLNVLSIHQAKGLEFPLVIVDVGSDFSRDHWVQRFKRFPQRAGKTQNLEDELRQFSAKLPPADRGRLARAFDDLIRAYFVAFSRAQDVLLLVGHSRLMAEDKPIKNVATGWDRNENWVWGPGLPDLEMI